MPPANEFPSVATCSDPKLKMIGIELREAGEAVANAQRALDTAEAGYQMALGRFTSARKFLFGETGLYTGDGTEVGTVGFMLAYHDLRPFVFTGLDLGEAIENVLRAESKTKRLGWLSIDEIIDRLEEGGFTFRGHGQKRRAVNAALINLTAARKSNQGRYRYAGEE